MICIFLLFGVTQQRFFGTAAYIYVDQVGNAQSVECQGNVPQVQHAVFAKKKNEIPPLGLSELIHIEHRPVCLLLR